MPYYVSLLPAMMPYYVSLLPVRLSASPILLKNPMRKTAKPVAPNNSAADVPVRKEFPETWLWQTIAKRLDTFTNVLFDYCVVYLFGSMIILIPN